MTTQDWIQGIETMQRLTRAYQNWTPVSLKSPRLPVCGHGEDAFE